MPRQTNPHSPNRTPLVRLGQGDYTREIHPGDLNRHVGAAVQPLDLGFLISEPANVYHARAKDNLSSHALKDFRWSPRFFRMKELGLVASRDSEALLVGRAAHTLILEGRTRYETEYAIGGPINPKTGKPFGSATKAFGQWAETIGKPVLDDTQAALIELMAASVKEHLFARELLCEGVAEGVARCDYIGHPCQVRLDWINPLPGRGLVDLKTCENLDFFEHDFRRLGYANQLAFYRDILERVTGELMPVHVIAVEKHTREHWLDGFHRCGVWAIDTALLDQARSENKSAMTELTRCRQTGVWATRFESLRLIKNT